MVAVILKDRGVIDIGGAEAGDLLQRLLTNDVIGIAKGEARYAALLTPQGKILADFLVSVAGGDAPLYRLDCPRDLVADLARKLTLYRLRAKVTIVDRSAELGVAALWPDAPDGGPSVLRDTRSESLGYRLVAPHGEIDGRFGDTPAAYDHHRILAGIPQGGVDFVYGDTFPHEANLDRLHGLDFKKGCYVGQEVVSRVEHRGTARKRVVRVAFDGLPPRGGAEVMVGEIAIGTMGSAVEGHGLAMIRTDRAAEAMALGAAITCDGTRLMVAAA